MSYDDFEVDEETNEVLDEIAKEIDMKVNDLKPNKWNSDTKNCVSAQNT